MLPLVDRALTFATKAHAGVYRKFTGEPYVTHPVRVADLLKPLGFGPEVIAAALLHDVIEDTDTTAEMLAAEFGPVVAALVLEVSNPVVPGNWKVRKAAARKHLAKSSYEGASIKLADMLVNSSNVAAVAPTFAAEHLAGMQKAMKVLGHGHPALFVPMAARLAEYFSSATA